MPLPLGPIILGGLGLADAIFGGKRQQRQVDTANAYNQNDQQMQVWQLLAQLLPELSRQQQLDPVRNAVLTELIGRHLPGVDPSALAGLAAAGPREGVPTPPQFIGAPRPSLLTSAIESGSSVIPGLIAEIERRGRGRPGEIPTSSLSGPNTGQFEPPQMDLTPLSTPTNTGPTQFIRPPQPVIRG